jgi:hypothetical protein
LLDAFSTFSDTLSSDGLLSDDDLNDDEEDIDPNAMYFTSLKDDQELGNFGAEIISQVEITLDEAAAMLQNNLLIDQGDNNTNNNNNNNTNGNNNNPQRAGVGNNAGTNDLITTTADENVIKTLTKPIPDKAKQEKDWLFLAQLFIHTSDLCGQLLPLSIALKWEKCISEEFSQQGCMERAQNLTPLPFLNDLHFLYNRSKGQVGFVSFVLLPWWIQLSRLFPSLGQYHRQCEDNKAHYQSIVNQIEIIRTSKSQQWNDQQVALQQQDPNHIVQPYIHVPQSHAPALPTKQPLPPHPTDPSMSFHKPCKHHGKWITIVPHKQLAQIFPFVTPNNGGQLSSEAQFKAQKEQFKAHFELYGNDVLSERLLNKDEQSQIPLTTLPQREGDVPIPPPLSCGFHHMSSLLQQQQQQQTQSGNNNSQDNSETDFHNTTPIIVPTLGPEQNPNNANPTSPMQLTQVIQPIPVHSLGQYKHAPRFITMWQCCHRLQIIPEVYDHEKHGE